MTERGSIGDITAAGPAGNDRRIPVAAFDFDGTLTFCDTLLPFLRYAAGRQRFWAKSPYLLGHWLFFRMGRMDRSEAKEAMLRRYLHGWPVEDVRAVAQRFAAGVLPALLNPAAMERLRWHQQAEHRVLIVSASLDVYLDPWAEAVTGIETVLCTRLRVDDGRVTGRLDELNCVGPEKVRRVAQHLGDLDGHYLYAYGDSSSDLEILGIAQCPAYRSFAGRWGKVRGYLRFLRALL